MKLRHPVLTLDAAALRGALPTDAVGLPAWRQSMSKGRQKFALLDPHGAADR